MQLILANKLAREYAETLNPYVRGKFLEMWQAAQVDDDYQVGWVARTNCPALQKVVHRQMKCAVTFVC